MNTQSNHSAEKSDIGIIGLGVMGENLALNFERHAYRVSVYNRPHQAVESLVERFLHTKAKGKNFLGFESIPDFIESLQTPRKILMMLKSGSPVDDMLGHMLPHLSPGDVIMDGGNSHFQDTERRMKILSGQGIHYMGVGISGGEEGALHGPSIMPGGSPEAWPLVRDMLKAVAAKDEEGFCCCEWMGRGSAGHFVKMVHNGIEYADMQLIAETYLLMRDGLGMTSDQMAEVFEHWNQGRLSSYLIQITGDILRHKDKSGHLLLDKILDSALQKGTGIWSVSQSLELGVPVPLISTSVYERMISGLKELRTARASKENKFAAENIVPDISIPMMESALYASKLMAYAQGFALLKDASLHYGWNLNLADIARIWRAGCIIRAAALNEIMRAYRHNAHLPHLLFDPEVDHQVGLLRDEWKDLLKMALSTDCPMPAYFSAYQYFLSISTERSGANLIQAQRDYFGAHTFERTDQARGVFFHENWTKVIEKSNGKS